MKDAIQVDWYEKIVHLWRYWIVVVIMKLSIIGDTVIAMTRRYKNSFRIKMLNIIAASGDAVILRADLNKYGSSRQVSRALKALVEDGDLIKIGRGAYVKAEKSPYSPSPIMSLSLAEACAQVLDRLGVRWQLGQAIQDYNSGKTQQVPVKFTIRLKDRFRGELGMGRRKVIFEGGINAR